MAAPAGQFLVVHVGWDDEGTPRGETYGPWAAAEDDSHLAAITEFVRAWPDRAGFLPGAVTLALCTDPAAWLAGEAVTAAPMPGAGGRAGIEPADPQTGYGVAIAAAASNMAAGRPRTRG